MHLIVYGNLGVCSLLTQITTRKLIYMSNEESEVPPQGWKHGEETYKEVCDEINMLLYSTYRVRVSYVNTA